MGHPRLRPRVLITCWRRPRSGWPCLGVQWHPEKMHEPEQDGLFPQLVQAMRVPA